MQKTTWAHGLVLGTLFLAFSAGCAPRQIDVRGANLWDVSGKYIEPPLNVPPIRPAFVTEPITGQTGDVGIWIHPKEINKSMILGLDSEPGYGKLHVFGLDGRMQQTISGFPYPIDLDIEYGYAFGSRKVDIVAILDRSRKLVRFFGINPRSGRLWEITGKTTLFAGMEGPEGVPSAITLFKNKDGQVSLIAVRRADDGGGILWQYDCNFNEGRIDLKFKRDFARFSGAGVITQIVADDFHGNVFYYDRGQGLRKYSADPTVEGPDREITSFALDGWTGPVNGISIFPSMEKPGHGWLGVLHSSVAETKVRFFQREGAFGSPDDHTNEHDPATVTTQEGVSLDLTPQQLDDRFPEGLIVIGSKTSKRFEAFSWKRLRLQYESFRKNAKKEKLREMSNNYR